MAKFGKYKVADVQTGLGAFPDTASNIQQNTQPTLDNATIAEGQGILPPVSSTPASAGPQVLTSQEIYDILKKNKAE